MALLTVLDKRPSRDSREARLPVPPLLGALQDMNPFHFSFRGLVLSMLNMPSVTLDLGSSELQNVESGWRAKLHSKATFASSAEDDLDRLYERLTYGALNHSGDNLPWVTRGHALRLDLYLRLHALQDLQERTNLADSLAMHLRTAQLWRQLCLVPGSVECSSPSPECFKVSVCLENSDGSFQSSLHKLATDVPIHDVQLPLGIPTVIMDCVRFDLTLEKGKKRKRRRLLRSKSNAQALDRMASFPAFCSGLQTSDIVGIHVDNEDTAGKIDSSDEEQSYHQFWEGFFYPFHGNFDSDEPDMLLTSLEEYEVVSVRNSANTPALLKRSSSTECLETGDVVAPRRALLELLDAAIRTAMTSVPRYLPKAVRCIATNSLQRLAPLAPSVWSPGYLPKVASRAVFIPTIGHALENVVKNAISSNELDMRTNKLVSKSQQRQLPDFTTTECAPTRSTATWDRLIWRLLVRRAYDPQAANRLVTLSVAREDSTTDAGVENELLDIGLGIPHSLTVHEDDISPLEDFNSSDVGEDDLWLDAEVYNGEKLWSRTAIGETSNQNGSVTETTDIDW